MISAVELMGNQLLVSGDAPVILAKKRVAMAVTPAAGKDSLLFETTGDIESDFSKQKVMALKTPIHRVIQWAGDPILRFCFNSNGFVLHSLPPKIEQKCLHSVYANP